MHSQTRAPQAHTSRSSMKYVSGRDMVFTQNNNQCRGQNRAVKTQSNSTATCRHKSKTGRLTAATRHPRGGSKLCSRGPSFRELNTSLDVPQSSQELSPISSRLNKVFIATPTVSVSLQWFHATFRCQSLCVFCIENTTTNVLGMICPEMSKGFILFVSITR